MKKIGRQVLFLETGTGNPRNGEGSFLRCRDGSILFGYTEYTGSSWHDHASARLSFLISRDEGETWDEKGILLEKPDNCKNIMSLSLLRLGNGDAGAFYIQKNLDTRLTLAELASVACLSPNYFSYVFKKYNGISLWEYIAIKRVERAVEMLKTQKLTKLEIAEKCGFASASHFYKCFSAVTGKHPGDFTKD